MVYSPEHTSSNDMGNQTACLECISCGLCAEGIDQFA